MPVTLPECPWADPVSVIHTTVVAEQSRTSRLAKDREYGCVIDSRSRVSSTHFIGTLVISKEARLVVKSCGLSQDT
jgi:hypothetical protein